MVIYLNCGLLQPLECIKAAENSYYKNQAPLNAVEGFIRQILGWREYIRGIYWLKMPQYSNLNFLDAKRDLPDFYWTADTKMNCLRQCVLETKKNEPLYIPTVEQVQDLVEEKLMESAFHDVAKAYILYRDEQARNRKTNITLICCCLNSPNR